MPVALIFCHGFKMEDFSSRMTTLARPRSSQIWLFSFFESICPDNLALFLTRCFSVSVPIRVLSCVVVIFQKRSRRIST